MEAVGLGCGVVSLAGLFSACIDCFQIIQQGRYLGEDFLLLETKFANQKLRFTAWGQACQMTDPQGYDQRLDEEDLHQHIEETLLQIMVLFKEGKNLRQKYGLKKCQGQELVISALPAAGSMISWLPSGTSTFIQKLHELKRRIERTRKQAGIISAVKWAIEDKRKFADLVQHLKDLIDDLESITRHLGIEGRQREIIRHEVESVTDISSLQAIEKARLGNPDAISDAASFRLWRLRDQCPRPDHDGIESPFDRVEAASLSDTDGCYDLCYDLEGLRPESKEASYQTLYRVRCPEYGQQFFLSKSTARWHDDENEWAFIDPKHPTQMNDNRPLENRMRPQSLDMYLEHNSALQFVVFEDCRCYCEADDLQHEHCLSSTHSIRLLSEDLCVGLRTITGACTLSHLLPEFGNGIEMQAPYIWFYYNRAHLTSQINESTPELRDVVKPLLDCIDNTMGDEYSEVDSLLADGMIRWKYIRYIFLPEEILVQKNHEWKGAYDTAFQQVSWPTMRIEGFEGEKRLGFEVLGWCWRYEGGVFRYERKLSVDRINAQRKFPIDKMPFFPLKFDKSEAEKRLRYGGELFWKLKDRSYVSYTGTLVDSQEFIRDGRFIVDHSLFVTMEGTPNARIRQAENKADVQGQHDMPEDPFVLLLPQWVHGYDLRNNRWVILWVLGASLVLWDKNALNDHFMDVSGKELSLDLMNGHVSRQQRPSSEKTQQSSQGLVLLFCGPPGVGKSSAAEALSESMERPLLKISLASIGSSASDLEKHLKTTMCLGTVWECVLLLDDAETILESRPSDGMSGNAHITAFTQLLKGFKGILILTSTRVRVLDPAVKSQITLIIWFDSLNEQQRRTIWINILRKYGAEPELLSDIDAYQIPKIDMEASEIHRVISTAQQIASYKDRRLDCSILRQVIKLGERSTFL